ncbi:hypothetical protein Pph01_77990 [Planotetraspora phitsanulokensis]|uniref:Tn3 transposase DDE domain-containing protein n=1 Tax=Planotetraspora phitsanulokensis TaxID=575192 RepID=A0A8J3UGC7_9ACTN|nr:hypothetical protein Pph01_77990 [Planotetraspora phitsanulokensis]
MLNALVLFNTRYLDAAVTQLRAEDIRPICGPTDHEASQLESCVVPQIKWQLTVETQGLSVVAGRR